MTVRGFAVVGLYNPKDPANIGAALRAAGCYRADAMLVQGFRWSFCRRRRRLARTDTQCAHKHIPVCYVDDLIESAPYGAEIVVVEIDKAAIPLPGFQHPESAFYIFGPEDGSVPEEIRRANKTVAVPTAQCMNLAASVNVVLYDRLAKRARKDAA